MQSFALNGRGPSAFCAGFPKLYDIYENKAEVYFVMERCYGGELTDALAERGSLRYVVHSVLYNASSCYKVGVPLLKV
jgi:serine/threonine protein kinase